MPLDLEAELDSLYGAEPGDFVAERKRIAGALKQEGRKAEAAQVLELRKPSLPAWAVNQLVRRRRKDVDELIAAGDRLTEAQQALVESGDRAGFAKARKDEQAVIKRLRQAAAAILGDRTSETTLDRVASTLEAAAVTAEGREQLAEGRLTVEVAAQGFEAFAGTLPAGPPRVKPPPTPKPAAKKPVAEKRPSADDRKQRRQEAVSQARAKLKAAREREADAAEKRRHAERAVTVAAKALADAERKAARLVADHASAADAVDAARRDLDAAQKA